MAFRCLQNGNQAGFIRQQLKWITQALHTASVCWKPQLGENGESFVNAYPREAFVMGIACLHRNIW